MKCGCDQCRKNGDKPIPTKTHPNCYCGKFVSEYKHDQCLYCKLHNLIPEGTELLKMIKK